MTLSNMAFSKMKLSIMTLSNMEYSKMTLSIMTLYTFTQYNNSQHSWLNCETEQSINLLLCCVIKLNAMMLGVIMLSVAMLSDTLLSVIIQYAI
jgi:hypothetical protein